MEPSVAVRLRGVVASYGRRTPLRDNRRVVLDHIDLDVPAGEILGLIGPSGCGKTTTVANIMGMLVPDEGTVEVLGERAPYPNVRACIGYMPQEAALYEDITARENLRFFAAMQGLSAAEGKREAERILAFSELEDAADRLVRTFSGGMQRRLSLAIALLGHPKLLVLDEPTVGLDPERRRAIWEMFRTCADEGCALLVTTHVMDEAERCDRVALLREGHIVAEGKPRELVAHAGVASLEDVFIAGAEGSRHA